MSMAAEPLPVRWLGQHAVVTMPDEIDITNAPRVHDELLAAVGSAAGVIADLSRTTFCDSSGVSALVRAYRQAVAGGCELRLVASQPAVLRILTIQGVDRLIDIYPELAAALDSLPAAQPDPAPPVA